MHSSLKIIIFWIVILVSATLLWQVVKQTKTNEKKTPEISYSEFLTQVNSGNVTRVTISGTRVSGIYRDRGSFRAVVPTSQEQMLTALQAKGTEIWYSDSGEQSTWSWPTNLLPLLLLATLWYFMTRQMRLGSKALQARAATQNSPPPIG